MGLSPKWKFPCFEIQKLKFENIAFYLLFGAAIIFENEPNANRQITRLQAHWERELFFGIFGKILVSNSDKFKHQIIDQQQVQWSYQWWNPSFVDRRHGLDFDITLRVCVWYTFDSHILSVLLSLTGCRQIESAQNHQESAEETKELVIMQLVPRIPLFPYVRLQWIHIDFGQSQRTLICYVIGQINGRSSLPNWKV